VSLPGAVAVTVALLAGNAFFVIAEFALITARRPPLERAAARGSRAARAAAAAMSELPLMLAGAQLGVTMCSLGLGAVTEPAVEHVLAPPLHSVGAPEAAAEAVALAVALAVVTFVHMVAGEMAPKSWAITSPERAALAVALPFRAFTRLTRPVLAVLNGTAALLVRAAGVRPSSEASDHPGPQHLARLITRSRRLGLLGTAQHDLLTRALTMHHATISGLITPAARVAVVPAGASPGQVRRAAAASGHTRLLVRGADGAITGLVHVRDAVTGTAAPTAAAMAYPVPALAPATPVLQALTTLRAARSQLAVIASPDEPFAGIISLDDLLSELLTANPH
jgi:CBS domain containing-hemolysin-like protein